MKNINYLFAAGVLALSTSATAAPTITGYDVSNATPSGTGGWSHTYTGTITNLGSGLQDYSAGTGTMSDGILGSTVQDVQLFETRDNASITVFLDDFYKIDSVSIYGGTLSNSIPGRIDFADFAVGSVTSTILGSGFGALGQSGQLINDEFFFAGSGLDQLRTNQFTISNIDASFLGAPSELISIGEITVAGVLSPVPEPSTYALMLGGLGLVGFMAARRRKQA